MTKQAYSYLLFGQLLNELPKGVFTHNEIGLWVVDILRTKSMVARGNQW